jgi:hypothetical protein
MPLATAPMKHISLFFIISSPSPLYLMSNNHGKIYLRWRIHIASDLFCYCNHCRLSFLSIEVFLWKYCPV